MVINIGFRGVIFHGMKYFLYRVAPMKKALYINKLPL